MKNGKTLVISTILVVLIVCGSAASAATAPSPPTNVVCSLSGTSLTVSWKAPSSTPVPIADYRVHIYKNSALSIETFVKEPTHTITFTNQLAATYEAHVRSRTSTGVMSTNSVVAKCSVVTVPPVPVPTFNISGFEINALDNSGLSRWNIRLLNGTTGLEITIRSITPNIDYSSYV